MEIRWAWILCLGLCPVELAALDYSDINFKNNTVKITNVIFRNKIEKIRAKYKIRELKIPRILLNKIDKKQQGLIFENLSIDNYEILLNTHIKLLIDKNVQINVISKNLGFHDVMEFVLRYNFLLPQKLDDDFEIIKPY